MQVRGGAARCGGGPADVGLRALPQARAGRAGQQGQEEAVLLPQRQQVDRQEYRVRANLQSRDIILSGIH